MEQVARLELASSAWKAEVIPIYDTCLLKNNLKNFKEFYSCEKKQNGKNNKFKIFSHIGWSGQQDSNLRLPAPKAGELPTVLCPDKYVMEI